MSQNHRIEQAKPLLPMNKNIFKFTSNSSHLSNTQKLYIVAFIIPFWKVFCMIGQKEKNKKDSQKNCLYTAIFKNQFLIKIVCFKIRKSPYKLGVTLTIIILSITSIPKSVFLCSKVVLFFQLIHILFICW